MTGVGDTTNQMFIPVGNDTSQTTTSTTHTNLGDSLFIISPERLHGGQYVYAELWAFSQNQTAGESVTFALMDQTTTTRLLESEVTDTDAGWSQVQSPRIRLLEDPQYDEKYYNVSWKVSGGTGEVGQNASLGVMVYW